MSDRLYHEICKNCNGSVTSNSPITFCVSCGFTQEYGDDSLKSEMIHPSLYCTCKECKDSFKQDKMVIENNPPPFITKINPLGLSANGVSLVNIIREVYEEKNCEICDLKGGFKICSCYKAKLVSPEGLKYDSDKAPLNLISNYAMEELAKVLDFGAKKYHPWNWAKGINYSRVIAAAKRHISAWENGIDIDEESKAHHLASAMCNLMFLLDYEVRQLKEFDDRRPKETLKK